MEDKKFEVKMIGSDGEKYYVILNDKDDVEELTDFIFNETNCEVSVRPFEPCVKRFIEIKVGDEQ